jgi:hypothetical protein
MGKPPRNSSRAYDEQGKEITPATVASVQALGLNTVAAFCERRGCERSAVVSLDGWSGEMPIPDLALYLRCSKCGGREIKIMLNVGELYLTTHGAGYVGRWRARAPSVSNPCRCFDQACPICADEPFRCLRLSYALLLVHLLLGQWRPGRKTPLGGWVEASCPVRLQGGRSRVVRGW